MQKTRLSESPSGRWTRPDEYVAAMARRLTARRSRETTHRSQPENPRFGLSTLPYLALIAALAVLTVAIAITAFPGSQPEHKVHLAAHQPGVASKGWLEDAEREFHR